jgi:hypothetical protein
MGLIASWFGGAKRRGREGPGKEAVTNDPFDLEYPLLWLSPNDPFTVRHAVEGCAIFGGVGSSKSTGSGATLARGFLAAGQGGLVLCVKPGERQVWEEYAVLTGRSDSLIVVSPSQPWRCNLLNYALKRPGVVGSRTEQVVSLFMTIIEAAERGEKGGGAKNDKFWERALRQLLRNAIEICVAAHGTVSIPMLHKLIASAPRSHDEVHDPVWQQDSLCYQLIVEGDARTKGLREQTDFDLAATYFLREFVDFPNETRGSVLATWGTVADVLLRGHMAELFGGETNFVPDVSFNGAVIILDLPVKVYGPAGVLVQAAFKYLWQLAAEQRDVTANPRPAFLFIDEAHELVTDYDMQFFATARSSRICAVLISQNLSNYYAVMGGETGRHRVEGALANLNTKIFHANGHAETNRWASSLFAKHWQVKGTFSRQRGEARDSATGGGSDSLESKVLEAEFTTLKKGGPENNGCAEAIVFQGGRIFRATGDTYLRTIFRQGGR